MAVRRLRIHGKVQGVCYRDWVVQNAGKLGLSGWVRNRMDGTVEAVLAGETEDIAHFVILAMDGPPAARVARVEETEEVDRGFSGFEVWATE